MIRYIKYPVLQPKRQGPGRKVKNKGKGIPHLNKFTFRRAPSLKKLKLHS